MLDSGSDIHVCGNKDIMFDTEACEPFEIDFRGSTILITQKGKLLVGFIANDKPLVLEDVYYLPGHDGVIISSNKLRRDDNIIYCVEKQSTILGIRDESFGDQVMLFTVAMRKGTEREYVDFESQRLVTKDSVPQFSLLDLFPEQGEKGVESTLSIVQA